MSVFYLIISFCTSLVGAICGIGGGVIIKPTLDFLALADAATVSFLSGCTVLAMSAYNVTKGIAAKESKVDFATATPLAIGASVGGVIGKQMFSYIKASAADPAFVGKVQAFCLMLVTIGTLLYMVYRAKIKTKEIKGKVPCAIIGVFLGIMSSFLGIGGGPINLVVFYFFFSMDTKTAAQNSLYTILFSQLTSLITTLVTHTVPNFDPLALALMIAGGITGGMAGRICNKKICSATVDKLFMGLMVVIIAISAFNTIR